MKISKIKITNFKGFNGEHTFLTNSDFIFLIGENNSGKTTLLRAIEFLKNGIAKDKKKQDYLNSFNPNGDVSVEIEIKGNIKEVIEDFSEAKYNSIVFNDDQNCETIRIRRSTKKETIKQNKKDVELDEKKITFWNNDTNQFENVTGIDKAIGSLFETQFIWSDTNPDDVTDFSSTKIVGKLLSEVLSDFQNTEEWKDFEKAHRRAFIESENSFNKKTKIIQQEIQNVMASIYGNILINFNFDMPDAKDLVKSGSINVNDGTETTLQEKGSGMQRAFALATIQVYADYLTKHDRDNLKHKPLFFFIDEPEMSLHPLAQKTLVNALKTISKKQQIFITSHSPYILREFEKGNDKLYIFSKKENNLNAIEYNSPNILPYVSFGEINYFAYQLITIEFHNELYGALQEKSERYAIKEFDKWLNEKHGIEVNKEWIHVKKGGGEEKYNVTLQTFIRNSIHHPENKKNKEFNPDELKDSCIKMISILKSF